jgi:cell division protein ZapA
MNDFSITVKIADRSYKLKIQREEEEIVRRAQASLKKKADTYADNFAVKDKQDLIAYVALESEIELLKLENEIDYENKEFKNRLEEIDELLSEIK